MTGVPQGGVLSPIFFSITLDYILMETNNEIREIVEGGRMLAYADDIIIAMNPNEKWKISKLIQCLDEYGLKTNPDKWQYLWYKEDEELSKLGRYNKNMKYLGVWVSYDKWEIIKSIKSKLKGSIKKIAWFSKHLSGKQQLLFKNWLMRSLLLYHTASSILTQEMAVTDLSNIIDSIERKIWWVPAWVPTATTNDFVNLEKKR